MKKRSVKKQARKAEKIILERNQEWIDNFITKNYSDEKKKSNKNNVSTFALGRSKRTTGLSRASVAAVGTLAGIIAIGLIVAIVAIILMLNPVVPGISIPKKHYLTENEKIAASDISELNSGLRGFSVKIDEGFESIIRRTYDSISGDTLYYNFELSNNDTTEKIRAYFYINIDFENHKTLLDVENVYTKRVGEFEIQYNEIKIDDDWAYKLKYNATTKFKEIPIYIEYEQYSFDGTSNFFNFIEQTFIVA